MAATGLPMRTLQEWMGHRDIATTQIYADYSPSSHEAAYIQEAFGTSRPPVADCGAPLGQSAVDQPHTIVCRVPEP
jgi:hypothetical protein